MRRIAALLLALVVVAPGVAGAAETPSNVRIQIERSDKTGQTPLWIPVRVTVTEGDGARPLSVDHLVFAAARNVLLTMIRVAGCTVMMPVFKARDFLTIAARKRMTHALLVPAMYNLCLLEPDFARYDLSAWRTGGFGGAPMPQSTIALLAAALPGLTLQNAYGATETTSPVTLLPPGDVARHGDTVGKVVACARVHVVDDSGRELPAGAAGELWVSGPMVIPGYWNNPEADATSFSDGCWKSGDIGSIDEDGYVRILDRKKDMINRGGYKVYCIEVENVLTQHRGVLECAIIPRPDDVLGERVHAFVVPRAPAPSEAELKAFCAQSLADYKVPDVITFLGEALPRNANGKVMKTALRQMIGAGA
jgi:acyl-CoA synthetase (AMP-forming)/AMP-acid ligase II